MEGTVLDFNEHDNKGFIRGDDGKRYTFSREEFKSSSKITAGQKVDFETNGDEATGIFVLSAPGMNFDGVKDKFTELSNNSNLKEVSNSFKGGIQNKFGLFLTFATLIALFLPFFNVPYVGTISIIDSEWGKFLLVNTLVIGALYYTGFSHSLTKIAVAVLSAVLFIFLYDVVQDINDANQIFGRKRNSGVSFFDWLQIGFFISLSSTMLMLFSVFTLKFKTR